MTVVFTILLALLMFGLLIFIHEFGHFITARLFHVDVEAFSIGMGPKLWKRTSQKTGITYSVGALPIGGYVAMTGEDEESDAPGALCNQSVWKRIFIVSAGAAVNIVFGFLCMAIFVTVIRGNLGSTVVGQVTASETHGVYQKLLAGDRILSVDGQRVHIAEEVQYEILRKGTEPVQLSVLREGVKVDLTLSFTDLAEDGTVIAKQGFLYQRDGSGFGSILRHAWYSSTLTVRMIWESLFDLLRGRGSLQDMAGPVGVTAQLGEVTKSGDFLSVFYFMIILSINLGVVNLLPLPALDGGRLVFLLFELIFRRPVPAKYEGMVHFAGILLLFGLMIVITFQDVLRLLG